MSADRGASGSARRGSGLDAPVPGIGHRNPLPALLAWILLGLAFVASPAVLGQTPAPPSGARCPGGYTAAKPRPVPTFDAVHPFALEALLEAYGPLPECLVQALEALLDPSLDKAGDERFTRREWTVAAGEQTIEVKESLFEGEPYFISLAGQFFLDPLRETSAKPLCLTLEMGWVTDPVVLFTCDPETVEQLARVIRTRSFVKQNASARLHRTATGELAPLFRIGGVGSGCTHCLRLTFEDAYVFKSDVSRSADGTGSLDFGYNDAILGMLEKIAREQGMTLRW